MFSNIGWGEVFFVLIIGLIVIGPERLPGVVEDVRAGIYAARKAINNAKAELNGEFEEFDEFRAPLNTVSQYAAMGPKRAMAKVLFDGDENGFETIDPRKLMEQSDGPVKSGPRPSPGSGSRRSQPGQPAQPAQPGQPTRPTQPTQPTRPAQPKPKENGGGFSWADIT